MLSKKSLKFRLPVLAVVLALLTTCTLGAITEHIATTRIKEDTGALMSRRASSLVNMMDRVMADRVANVSLHGGNLIEDGVLRDSVRVRAALDGMKASYDGFAWIGYADRSGRVIAATDGLLEGVDVSDRPWFQNASEAPFVGDLHRAVLLEKKLNADGSEPLRFLDVAIPLVGDDRKNVGVLGAHIDWRWVKGLTALVPARQHSEFLIVAADNMVLFGPPDLQDKRLPDAFASDLRESKRGFGVARWPDGKLYLSGHALSRGYRAYSGLQWLIVERQDLQAAYSTATETRNRIALWGIGIAVVFALLGWIAAVRISQPLVAISDAAEAIEAGDTDARIPQVKSYREVMVLARTLSNLIHQLLQREAELEHQATHHPLTHLPNRVLIKALIDQTIVRARAPGEMVSVTTLSLAGFEHLNTTLGNPTGDQILRAVSARLKDLPGRPTIGHLGKDEFVLVLPERDTAASQTMAATQALQSRVAEPVIIDGNPYFVAPVIGISHYPKDAQSGEALLGCSEAAMHHARRQGGNSLHIYHAEMNATVIERLELERELRVALERRQFELHYQPQISLRTGDVVGVEALIRWRHPVHGLISPAKFIPLAEASGFIIPLGEWILNEACRQAKQWHDAGFATLPVAVNVSSRQFVETDMLAQVALALDSSGLDPAHLKLEITESMLMNDVDKSVETMHRLDELGVKLAIDDFGTGYSSLSYLSQFPISQLKVDQSFVRTLTPGTDNAAIVSTIIALGHNLGMRVIAEGVETSEQADFLQHAGCDEIQGYYFSKPLTAADLTKLLQRPSVRLAQRRREA